MQSNQNKGNMKVLKTDIVYTEAFGKLRVSIDLSYIGGNHSIAEKIEMYEENQKNLTL